MGPQKYLASLLVAVSLMGWGQAYAVLAYATRGDVLEVWGKAEKGDADKLKEHLTPTIKTVVMRSPDSWDWDLSNELAKLIDKAEVTTVVHGPCSGFACTMMFLSGKQRMFSGAGRPERHYLTISIPFNSPWCINSVDQTPCPIFREWWHSHTKLSNADLQPYQASLFSNQTTTIYDRKIFFPAQAKFSRGNVIHCAGENEMGGKRQSLVDCMPVPDATALNRGIVTTDELFIYPALTEKDDIKPPAPTDIAKIDGVPVAKISDDCVAMYKDFLKQDSPKAFVVNSGESCNWTNAQSFHPYESAMSDCRKTAGVECRFYAVDDKVVFVPFDQKIPTPSVSSATITLPANALVLDQQNISLLLARNADKENGPSGVSDRFATDGEIFAYLTFKWDDVTLAGGRQRIEIRWFNGDKLIRTQRRELELGTSPHSAWTSTLAAEIGSGSARVEVYVKDKLIVSKSFSVVEKL